MDMGIYSNWKELKRVLEGTEDVRAMLEFLDARFEKGVGGFSAVGKAGVVYPYKSDKMELLYQVFSNRQTEEFEFVAIDSRQAERYDLTNSFTLFGEDRNKIIHETLEIDWFCSGRGYHSDKGLVFPFER